MQVKNMRIVYHILFLISLATFTHCDRRTAAKPRYNHAIELVDGHICVYGGKKNGTSTSLANFALDFICVDATKRISRHSPNWKTLSSASRFVMPPMAQHRSVYDRQLGIVVPYGGQLPSGFTNVDTLTVFSTRYRAWGRSSAIASMPRRYAHSMVHQKVSGDAVVFGGVSDETTGGSSARWRNPARMILDPGRHKEHSGESRVMGEILTDVHGEPPRALAMVYQHTATLVNDTQMVVLGGDNWVDEVFANGTHNGHAEYVAWDRAYVYDIDRHVWSIHNCSGDVPTSRFAHTADLYDHAIYVFGGVNRTWEDLFGDLFRLDLGTWTWTQIKAPNPPAPRYAHASKVVGHYLVISNGIMAHETGDPHIYFFDLDGGQYVDSYEPNGIPLALLDAEWTRVDSATCIVLALICGLFASVCGIAATHLLRELRRVRWRQAAEPRIPTANTRFRSIVSSYTGSLEIARFARLSSDHGKIEPRPVRGMSVSDGTTMVGADQGSSAKVLGSSVPLVDGNMRHTRVFDTTGDCALSRRLTISTNLPVYEAPLSPVDRDYADELESLTGYELVELRVVNVGSRPPSL